MINFSSLLNEPSWQTAQRISGPFLIGHRLQFGGNFVLRDGGPVLG
jgi:hypothetical protein